MHCKLSKAEEKRANRLLKQIASRPEVTGVEIFEWIGELEMVDVIVLCRFFGCGIKNLDRIIVSYSGVKAGRQKQKC